MRGFAFISYSRREFYFAESLTGHLARRGVSAWLDVEHLELGSDWDECLREALAACECIILVASRSSLASPYVTREWRLASAAGKPIYVALFERAALPPELATAPVFNFRTHFESAADSLAGHVNAGTVPEESVPAPVRWHLPLPGSVSLVATALAAGFGALAADAAPLVYELIGGRDYASMLGELQPVAPFGAVLVLSNLSLTALYFVLLVHFLRRSRTRFGEIRLCLAAVPVLALMSYETWLRLADYMAHGGPFLTVTPRPVLFEWLLPPMVGAWILGWAAFFWMARSEDMLRWLLPGEAPDSVRLRFSDRALLARTVREAERDRPYTFTLEYAPGDADIASRILLTMPDRAFLSGQPQGAADDHILILSNCTPERTARRAFSTRGARLISVVASNLRLPVDADAIHRYQWVDYRRRADDTLRAMASTLLSGPGGGPLQGSTFVPEALHKPVLPSGVFRFSTSLKFLVAVNLAVALAPATSRTGTLPWVGQNIAGLTIALLIAGLMAGLLARLVTFRILVAGFASAWLGMLFSGVAESLARFFPAYAVGPFNAMAVICFVTPLGALLWFSKELREWLPALPQWTIGGTGRLAAIDGLVEWVAWAFLVAVLVTASYRYS